MPSEPQIYPSVDPCLRERLVIISGHGCYYPEEMPGSTFTCPDGVTITRWGKLGSLMSDSRIGQLLDRGCTTTAWLKMKADDNPVRTYRAGETVPNLIILPPDKLKIRQNQADDQIYVFPLTFAQSNGTVSARVFAPDAVVSRPLGSDSLRASSLFHIVRRAIANGHGSNFHWAACLEKIDRRNRFGPFGLDLLAIGAELFDMTAQHPDYR